MTKVNINIKVILNYTLFVLFLLSFTLALLSKVIHTQQEPTTLVLNEKFDHSLSYLNTSNKVLNYWDSLTVLKKPANSKEHIWLLSNLIMHRFYHKYCYYTFEENPLAFISANLFWSDLSAIVIPDDILKYDYAACSQQSIIMMELLKARNYKVRKIGFKGTPGHFCLEAYYDNAWHFYDPNKEPSMRKYCQIRPSAIELVNNKELLYKIYESKLSKNEIDAVFIKDFDSGNINEFPASKIILFHYVTYFLSFYFWLIPLFILISINYKYIIKKINNSRRYSYT